MRRLSRIGHTRCLRADILLPVVEGSGGLASLTPVRVTMGRLAAGTRGTVTIAAVASAVIGTVPPLSWRWVAPVLVVLVVWSAVYVRVAWTVGPRPWLALPDLALGCFLCLNLGHLVPETAIQGTSWVGVTASMMVVWAQVTGSPAIYVPAGLVVAGSFIVGSHLAHSPDSGISYAITMATQAAAGAAVMQIAVRAGRLASRTFDELQAAERSAEIQAVQRADERAQLRLLHNGPLTTLTMAIHGDGGRSPSPLLRQRAAANLAELQDLAREPVEGPDAPDGGVRLDERLAQVVVWYEPTLQVSARLPECVVPRTVADAFAEATSESMENVVRHAHTDRAALVLEDADDRVRVTVTDRGRGFDPANLPRQRFGIREAMIGRMATAGGSARVHSRPGEGTIVLLEWDRG